MELGFWWGLFDGFFILFRFIASFWMDIHIYEFPHTAWYDAGFVLGILMFAGACAHREADPNPALVVDPPDTYEYGAEQARRKKAGLPYDTRLEAPSDWPGPRS